MKGTPARFGLVSMLLLFGLLAVMTVRSAPAAAELATVPETTKANVTYEELKVGPGETAEASDCLGCHAQETPGIVAGWEAGKMGRGGISCYYCHVVPKDSPMASQCAGIEGSETYTSPMVSSATCATCHPKEVAEFLESGHAMLASQPLLESDKMLKLMYYLEGGEFIGVEPGTPANVASRAMGCMMCHGTRVEVDENNRPVNATWPGGVGTRYPDGSVGNCTVCHTRHEFSIAEAHKPEACASCHLGPDHPDIEIYLESKHGQMFAANGEEWNWDKDPDNWQPGDYLAPTCAVCHMSGIGELDSTHNINERLKWDLVHMRSEIRTGERGNGIEGDRLMRLVCKNCHSSLHTNTQRDGLDAAVELYNAYWDRAVEMKTDLADRGLLKDDAWNDGFQELMYYLWHHTGRRARHGAAMNGPDYAHWHGFFQMFQVYKDMEAIYNKRVATGEIEEMSLVMNSGPQ